MTAGRLSLTPACRHAEYMRSRALCRRPLSRIDRSGPRKLVMPRPIRRYDSQSAVTPRRSALPSVELEISRGRARELVRPIEGLVYLIGAAEDNDLVLADPQFPDSHSYLLRSPLGLTLCWLGEGPEVTVDGVPTLGTALVPDGSRLRTGPFEFRIRLTWPSVADSDAADSDDFSRAPNLPESVIGELPGSLPAARFPSTLPFTPTA
jgi:hypothetical protein